LKTEPDHIDELIASYLAGEASGEQIALVEDWKNGSEENERYFEQLALIFKKAASAPTDGEFNTDLAWQEVRSQLSLENEGGTVPLYPKHGYQLFMRIAAGIIILLTVGFFTQNFFRADSDKSIELLADNTTESDTLPDGSDVFLNRQTKIEYTFNEDAKTHTAKLAGEAYFNINHDDEKKFIVEAEGTFIRDIGTAFNVKAYPGSPTIEVVVEQGEVMFYAEGNPGIYLKANGKGVYNKNTKTFTVAEPEPNVTAYKTKFFSFSNHSLGSVVETLNDVYDEKIRIDENLKVCTLTVSFNNETLEEIAGIIAETLGLSVSRSGEMITLKGPGCGETGP